jgi:hypothetical protein
LPNRILPSLRRVFPFAAFGHWIVLKNKLKNSFFSVHFLGTSSRSIHHACVEKAQH